MSQPGMVAGRPSSLSAAQVTALFPPATAMRLYTQPQVLPGDTLSATTAAEQPFASQVVIPANSLIVGQAIHVKGTGVYSTPALTAVTQEARLRFGGTQLIDSGAQSVPVNLSACRYEFDLQFIVRSLGATGTVEACGRLIFATSLTTAITILCGPSGTAAESGNPVTVDTTKDNAVTLSCQFGGVQSGNTNSMRQISIYTFKPVT